jgi:transposase
MAYRIAGIDVHKKMLAVVVSDVEVDGEYQFERRKQLCAALGAACTELNPVYRRLLKMVLEQLQFLEQQIGQLD